MRIDGRFASDQLSSDPGRSRYGRTGQPTSRLTPTWWRPPRWKSRSAGSQGCRWTSPLLPGRTGARRTDRQRARPSGQVRGTGFPLELGVGCGSTCGRARTISTTRVVAIAVVAPERASMPCSTRHRRSWSPSSSTRSTLTMDGVSRGSPQLHGKRIRDRGRRRQ